MTREKSVEQKFEELTIPVTESGCVLWLGYTNKKGYGQLQIGGRKFYAHRVAYEMKHGKIPDGMCACHKCDVSSCVNPDHIFLGSLQDNANDMYRKGRQNRDKSVYYRGEQITKSKITEKDVINIRNDERTLKEIAKDYGMHFSAIWFIKTRRNWKHVK